MQRKHDVHWPQAMKSLANTRSMEKCYRFHKDHGNNTNDYI